LSRGSERIKKADRVDMTRLWLAIQKNAQLLKVVAPTRAHYSRSRKRNRKKHIKKGGSRNGLRHQPRQGTLSSELQKRRGPGSIEKH